MGTHGGLLRPTVAEEEPEGQQLSKSCFGSRDSAHIRSKSAESCSGSRGRSMSTKKTLTPKGDRAGRGDEAAAAGGVGVPLAEGGVLAGHAGLPEHHHLRAGLFLLFLFVFVFLVFFMFELLFPIVYCCCSLISLLFAVVHCFSVLRCWCFMFVVYLLFLCVPVFLVISLVLCMMFFV